MEECWTNRSSYNDSSPLRTSNASSGRNALVVDDLELSELIFNESLRPGILDVYKETSYVVDNIILPIVFAVGVLGNVCNLVILRQRRFRLGLHNTENSAIIGMVALGISDLCFCLIGFGSVLLPNNMRPDATSNYFSIVGFYYRVYRQPVLNIFIFISTWLVVCTSFQRFLAICHPFRIRCVYRKWNCVLIYAVVALVAILLNVPLFMKYNIRWRPCFVNCTCFYMEITTLWQEDAIFVDIHKILWAVLGVFIPFVTLVFFNCRIVHAVCTIEDGGGCVSEAYRHTHKKATNQITTTLTMMVFLFLVLAFPSMILAFVGGYLLTSDSEIRTIYSYEIAIVYTNLMQAVRFASNFLLYCVCNRHFRETIGGVLCGKCDSSIRQRHLPLTPMNG